jgi:hypothetical protein
LRSSVNKLHFISHQIIEHKATTCAKGNTDHGMRNAQKTRGGVKSVNAKPPLSYHKMNDKHIHGQ